ncbi:hypothetical protein BOTBODRAFT_53652 [Botryobasidium botryosum FD-172 SS1]|uniref:Uncharacterized protein n=1 Tax=Botryobasidium botryosum (strain FD-172 SS1) TaxID=930990 RepID=A0A067MN98_BOTB1|nr:hypothetical protein BOTBODRAFT_53652 [Botryobasidium botryosum FD-172 SS1]
MASTRQGQIPENSDEIIYPVSREYETNTLYLGDFSLSIYAYDGSESRPVFTRDKLGNMNAGFCAVCRIRQIFRDSAAILSTSSDLMAYVGV